MKQNEIETQIIEKANIDPTFRQRLLADPKEAIADLMGSPLPPGMTITVLEEKPGHHYLVLPPAPPSVDALPLDELELALVGGGRTLRPHIILCSGTNTKSVNHSATSTQKSSC
ncbi:MAG TPA: NHLP leader peptide family RiPP precursor [Anaerolineae bacterium]|nr:NHLP leader peptide family RiPP precursor [Anaerolineae bacterium]